MRAELVGTPLPAEGVVLMGFISERESIAEGCGYQARLDGVPGGVVCSVQTLGQRFAFLNAKVRLLSPLWFLMFSGG